MKALIKFWNMMGWLLIVVSLILSFVRGWENPLVLIGLVFGIVAWNNGYILEIKERLCME